MSHLLKGRIRGVGCYSTLIVAILGHQNVAIFPPRFAPTKDQKINYVTSYVFIKIIQYLVFFYYIIL